MSDADQFSGKTSEGACQQNIMLITHSVKNLFGSMSLRNLEGAVEDLSSSQPVTQAPVSLFLYMIALIYRVVKQK